MEEKIDHDFGRDEGPGERLDRNWNELLQELRVTQTGIQILFAFLLTLPFQARFDILDHTQRQLYVVIVALITASTLCVVTPVILHRMLFRKGAKDELVMAGDRLTIAGLFLLGAALICAVGLVVDVVIGRTAGFVAAGTGILAIVLAWGVLPRVLRKRSTGRYE